MILCLIRSHHTYTQKDRGGREFFFIVKTLGIVDNPYTQLISVIYVEKGNTSQQICIEIQKYIRLIL